MLEKEELVMAEISSDRDGIMSLTKIGDKEVNLRAMLTRAAQNASGHFCAMVQKIMINSSLSLRKGIRGGQIYQYISFFEALWVYVLNDNFH